MAVTVYLYVVYSTPSSFSLTLLQTSCSHIVATTSLPTSSSNYDIGNWQMYFMLCNVLRRKIRLIILTILNESVTSPLHQIRFVECLNVLLKQIKRSLVCTENTGPFPLHQHVQHNSLTLLARRPSLYVRVCRLQILTYKDGPRTDRMKIFIMAVDT